MCFIFRKKLTRYSIFNFIYWKTYNFFKENKFYICIYNILIFQTFQLVSLNICIINIIYFNKYTLYISNI